MSTEIKPGQIWAWNGDIDAEESHFRIKAVDANRARYEYVSDRDPNVPGGFFHKVDTLTEKAHLVKDATPAPLDPSKVKAGDTVTVTGGGVGSTQAAYEITGVAWEPGHSPGLLWVGPVCITATLVTLTAHQPAPEPEPEWKSGTVWADQEGERYWFTDDGSAQGPTFRNDVGDEYAPSEMGDVSALVVIDPATVDVDALVAAAIGRGYLSIRGIAAAVLAELGIEAS